MPQADLKEVDIIESIKRSTKFLTVIVLLIIGVLLFVNMRVIYTVHKEVSSLSIIVSLAAATGLVLVGFYLSRRISVTAMMNLMRYSDQLGGVNEELERRVNERTVELKDAVKAMEENIRERQRAEDKLYALTITDELTGLYNRRGFFTLADHRLMLAKREKQGLLMLYGDLDNLKKVNDTLGHETGDRMIKQAADVIKSTYRHTDIIARLGGDEFVVFPVGTTNDHVNIIAKRLQDNIDSYNARDDREFTLSISIGIVAYDPDKVSSIDGLLAQADRLMYEHKRSKRLASRA